MEELVVKPEVICVQETWLKPQLDFVVQGYVVIRRDSSEINVGVCATLVKEGVPYRLLELGANTEYIVIEVWGKGQKLVVVNLYNPCRRLVLDELIEVQGQGRRGIMWCGDFNAGEVKILMPLVRYGGRAH